MGIITPPPPIIDGTCAACDGVLWPAGQSPLIVKCNVAQIVKCGMAPLDAPDGDYWLRKLGECLWYLNAADGYEFWLDIWFVPSFFIWTTVNGDDWIYFSYDDPGCPRTIYNENTSCEVPLTAGIGGKVEFTW